MFTVVMVLKYRLFMNGLVSEI